MSVRVQISREKKSDFFFVREIVCFVQLTMLAEKGGKSPPNKACKIK